jgi:hypothetical protein
MGDKLLEDARKKAAEEKRSLNDLIVEALEQRIYSVEEKPSLPYRFSPVTHKGGGFTIGVDPTDNSVLLDVMEETDGSS